MICRLAVLLTEVQTPNKRRARCDESDDNVGRRKRSMRRDGRQEHSSTGSKEERKKTLAAKIKELKVQGAKITMNFGRQVQWQRAAADSDRCKCCFDSSLIWNAEYYLSMDFGRSANSCAWRQRATS
jgi:hypothetical protein